MGIRMNFVSKHQNSSFYIINFFATGILFALPPLLVPSVPLSLFLWAPAISAYIMVALTGEGIRQFSKDIFLPKVKARWLLVSIVLPIIIVLVAECLVRILQGRQFALAPNTSSVTVFLLVQVVSGAMMEEIGWRGFMLPRMITLYGNLKASVILGLVWGLWHVGDYGEGLGFVFFVVSTISLSVIITWLREKGGGGVLTAGFFHIFYNLAGVYFSTPISKTAGIPLISRVVTALVCLILAVFLATTSPVFRKKGITS